MHTIDPFWLQAYKKMNPHKVKREVLGIKLRIARSLKSDLISQFDVADMIRQEVKTVKDVSQRG